MSTTDINGIVNVIQGDLDDAATVATLVGMGNLANYTELGLEAQNLTTATAPGTFDLTEGKCFILLDSMWADGHGETFRLALITVDLDALNGIPLAGSGVNHVYVHANFRPTPDDPKIVVNQDDAPPTSTDLDGNVLEDSLKIAEIDTNASGDGAITPFNRAPSPTFADVILDTLTIGESVTWPDGVTTTGSPLTTDSELDNYNRYYDTNATDPPGVVNHATYADSAGHADTADYADEAGYAAEAGNAQTIDNRSYQDILNQLENDLTTTGEWTPLLENGEPFIHDNPSEKFEWYWDVRSAGTGTYDVYRIDLYTENHRLNFDNSLRLRVNNDTSERYYAAEFYQNHNDLGRTRKSYWQLGECHSGAFGYQSMRLACPRPIGNIPNHYPTYAAGHRAVAPTDSYEFNGVLTKSYRQIRQIELKTGNQTTGSVQLYGRNLY